MKAHQRIALALRVARSLGATVHVEPEGFALLRFRVKSPVAGRVATALTEAGFTVPNHVLTGFVGWEAVCPLPGYRATEYLFSLDGEGPLPARVAKPVRAAKPRAPARTRTRTRAPGTAAPSLAPPRDAADLVGSLGLTVYPDPTDTAPDTTPDGAPVPEKPTPPVTVLRRTRRAA